VTGAGDQRRKAASPPITQDSVLLHVCCGPCASAVVPAWRAEGLEPVALFYNPNIQPAVEQARRWEAMRCLAEHLTLRLEVVAAHAGVGTGRGPYPIWCPPEGAAPARCGACIAHRLDQAARYAAAIGVPRFATSLAVSPYQPHEVIREQGDVAAARWAVEFLYVDQRSLYRQSRVYARELDLYRQQYCGCVPSMWEAWHQRQSRRRRSVP